MSVRLALTALCVAALLGCGTTLDIDRARRWLAAPEPADVSPAPIAPTALPAPEGLVALSGELREIPLHWEPLLLSGVAGYVVERAEQREGPFTSAASIAGRSRTAWVDQGPNRVPSVTNVKPSGMGDGQTYFYRVLPVTSAGVLGKEASEVVAGTTAAPPDPPEDLRAYSHQPRRVPLSWGASTDPNVAGYVVERSPTSAGPFEAIADLTGRFETVFVDRGLGDLRVFYYRVLAVNRADGRGEPSKPVRAVTKPEPLPPVRLRVLSQRLGANLLAWDPNVEPDLAGYRLLRSRAGSETPEVVVSLGSSETQVIDSAVGADETVAYSLRAFDGDGLESDASRPIEVTSVGYELTATPRTDGVHLEWRARPDEGWNRARVFLKSAFGSTELGVVSGNSFVHADVKPGGRYRYSVVLERADGRRAPESSAVEVRVPQR